eukprot:13918257-Alexandrium_andersonii.AAC.1
MDAPSHRDFIKNMIAKGSHNAGEIQGQTRQHSRLINSSKQICVDVNYDCSHNHPLGFDIAAD